MFVQLVFNHSDPEPDLDDERHALNVEIEATPSSVVDILESTLAVLCQFLSSWHREQALLWHKAVSKSEKADLQLFITCAGRQRFCPSGVVCLSTVAEKLLSRWAQRNSLTCLSYWNCLAVSFSRRQHMELNGTTTPG